MITPSAATTLGAMYHSMLVLHDHSDLPVGIERQQLAVLGRSIPPGTRRSPRPACSRPPDAADPPFLGRSCGPTPPDSLSTLALTKTRSLYKTGEPRSPAAGLGADVRLPEPWALMLEGEDAGLAEEDRLASATSAEAIVPTNGAFLGCFASRVWFQSICRR
jgi:hypothetical protein